MVQEGSVSTSIGTSGVLFAHRDEFTPDASGRVHAFCHAVPGAFHLMAVTLSAGGSLSWWRERFGGGASFDELVEEAEAVEPGAEGLLFLPYLTGERTRTSIRMRAARSSGLTVRHGRGHMTRAVMEGVAFSMRDGLEIMRGLGTPDDDCARSAAAPARRCGWRCRPTSTGARSAAPRSTRARPTGRRCSAAWPPACSPTSPRRARRCGCATR